MAINSHTHHAASDVLAAIRSTVAAVRFAQVQGAPLDLRVVLFSQTPAAPAVAALAQDLGVGCARQAGLQNGPNLNAQMLWAQQAGCTLFFRVDADDLVSRERFLLQSQVMEDARIMLSGGGLLYRDRVSGQDVPVVPPKRPGAWAFVTNRYMLHPTLCIRLTPGAGLALSYWPERLEDKALAQSALAQGIVPHNDQAIYGVYHVSPSARGSAKAAQLNLRLDLAFLRVAGLPWMMPAAFAAHFCRRFFGAHRMRRLRNWLAAPKSPSSLTEAQHLPVKKEQKENS